jgi:hypothetical protein
MAKDRLGIDKACFSLKRRVWLKQRIRSPLFNAFSVEFPFCMLPAGGECYTLAERYGERIRCFTRARWRRKGKEEIIRELKRHKKREVEIESSIID